MRTSTNWGSVFVALAVTMLFTSLGICVLVNRSNSVILIGAATLAVLFIIWLSLSKKGNVS